MRTQGVDHESSPTLARPHIVTRIAAGALSLMLTTLLLNGVDELFVRDGLPMLIAQQACSDYSHWSEREACVQSLLVASYHHPLASR
jgi:hypothetical protein